MINEDEEAALATAFKNSDHEGEGMLQMDAAEYTIEGLRRDARKGEPGRRWTEYECELKPLWPVCGRWRDQIAAFANISTPQ